jgi:hypothetical protein
LDGRLKRTELVSENVIPVPLSYEGEIELSLESWNEAIHIVGVFADLELIDSSANPRPLRNFDPIPNNR